MSTLPGPTQPELSPPSAPQIERPAPGFFLGAFVRIAERLIVFLIGAVLLGNFINSCRASSAAKAAATKRLQLVRMEAEHNYDVALRLHELKMSVADREIIANQLAFTAAESMLRDELVYEVLPLDTVSLLLTYVRDGYLVQSLHRQYNEFPWHPGQVLPPNLEKNLVAIHDSLTYNAAPLAAAALILGQRLPNLVEPGTPQAAAFETALQQREKQLRDVTQGIIDDNYIHPTPPSRVQPSQPVRPAP